jgi:predicted GIY-YIG superfamily endonuclease
MNKDNTVDIIELVENSPLTKFSQHTDYKSKIVDKLKNRFTTTEQQLFLANFYLYLNYNNTTDFVIPLDNVWKWLGFGRINDAKRVIDKNFKENTDYKIYGNETNVFALQVGKAKNDEINKDKTNVFAPPIGGAKNDEIKRDKTNVFAPPIGGAKNEEDNNEINGIDRTEVSRKAAGNYISNNKDKTNTFSPPTCGAASETRGGHNKEYIYMTVNCFKKLCLKARTDKADEIHDYYIKLEEVLNETLIEETETLKNLLDKKTHENNYLRGVGENQIDINLYDKKSVVYILKIESDLFKYGYTNNILHRLSTHRNKIKDDIEIVKLFILESTVEARNIETLITTYSKTNKLNSSYKNEKREIIKTNCIGLVIEKINEWIKEYDKNHNNTIIDKIERLQNSGVNVNTLIANLPNMSSISPMPKLVNTIQKKIKSSGVKELDCSVKCSVCGYSKTNEEFGINPVTKQAYSTCKECRDKRAIKLTDKEIELANNEHNEKMKKLNEERSKLLNDNNIYICFYCKKEKKAEDFGINKRSNTIYKVCILCRGKKSSIDDDNGTECGKCKKTFDSELNEKTKIYYKTCADCREKDRLHRKNATEVEITECIYCHDDMEAEINMKNKKYYKSCKKCRDDRKKYDAKKYELHSDEIKDQKKEYYRENQEHIRNKQKEYYDSNKNV